MGKKKPKQEVNEYYMSQHLGIALKVDAITHLTFGDKRAWQGEVRTNTDIAIAGRSLFGGPKKEGGVAGIVSVLLGKPNQVLPNALALRLGRASGADCPAFRGLTTLFFTGSKSISPHDLSFSTLVALMFGDGGNDGTIQNGFYWTANTPYLKNIAVGVRCAPVGLNPDYAEISRSLGSSLAIYFLLDRSNSLSGSEFNAIKNAVRAGLDQIETHIELNPDSRVDVGVRFYSNGSVGIERTDVTTGDLDDIRSFITAASQVTGGDVEAAMHFVEDWFLASKDVAFDKRAVVFVTDSNSEDNMPEAAAGPAADMLDQDGGVFNRSLNTQVDMYAINYNTSDTDYTSLLDNTSEDGIPIITSSDETGLTAAVSRCLRTRSFDANPAHMIYECLVDSEWGMGSPASMIDYDSFETAGEVLYAEGLGLSMRWVQQDTIENFITEIIDHIQATLFVNPRTGLLTLKLIRDDYDPETLREITPDNADLKDFQRKGWGEVINEVVVTWTNPDNEEEETVIRQDDGVIAAQNGKVVSTSRNYYGVRTASLASKLAERDLRASCAPLASCEAELDRSAWDLLPGDVVKLTWPEHGLAGSIMRVGPVDYGTLANPTIKVSLVEDVFSFATAEYEEPTGSEWQGADEDPEAMTYSRIITLPAFPLVNFMADAGIDNTLEHPEVIAGVLASTNNGYTYDLYGTSIDSDGTEFEEVLATCTVIGRATLTNALAAAASSTGVEFTGLTGTVGPARGIFLAIGDDSDDETVMEMAMVSAETSGVYTVNRGLLDTVPRDWAAGTVVWMFSLDSDISDLEIRSDAETVEYKLLTRTFAGVLSASSAPTLSGTLSGRPHYPLRPANVKVDGFGFGTVDCVGYPTIPVTWSNRNRLTEDSQVLLWSAATVTPEAGQTTTITVTDMDGNVTDTITGLTGTSHDVPVASFDGRSMGIVAVSSKRDGFDSLQAHEITVIVESGYGWAYGFNYGGD